MTGKAKNTAGDDPLAARKKLTFAQAEGIDPLPTQLRRGEIFDEFRAVLWDFVRRSLMATRDYSLGDGRVGQPWTIILEEAHVFHHHKTSAFSKHFSDQERALETLFAKGPWHAVLGWLEFVLKHPSCPAGFAATANALMVHCRLGYRILDQQVVCPIGSDEERETIERAFADLRSVEAHGARAHLRKAADALSAGHFADSVRESIHAVELVAEMLEPSGEFSKAMAKLELKISIHGALKKGFTSIYGYTSNEQGIRHSLIDDPEAKVDETDALFMLGACAAFVSYLLNKARGAGLLTSTKRLRHDSGRGVGLDRVSTVVCDSDRNLYRQAFTSLMDRARRATWVRCNA